MAAAGQDRPILPVAVGRDTVDGLEHRRPVAQDLIDLGRGPNVIAAFFAFAVGIEGRGQAATVDGHLAQDPADRFPHPCGIEGIPRFLPNQGQELHELGVVVEHLLEMGDQPVGVGGVSGKAAAEVVVDAALAHPGQRDGHGVAQTDIAGPLEAAPQQGEDRGLGELRRRSDAAAFPVDLLDQPLGDLVQHALVERAARTVLGLLVQAVAQGGDILTNLVRLGGVGLGDGAQHLGKTGPAVGVARWKIGAAPERIALRGQKHRQGPATGLAH